jgi:Holliday junction resolvase
LNSRDKGKRGEREAARALQEHLGCNARRGVQFAGGPESPDVVHDVPGVHVEVKYTEKLNVWKAMDQATEDCGEKVPIVLHRKSRRDWLVMVPLERLTELCERVSECKSRPQLTGSSTECDTRTTFA